MSEFFSREELLGGLPARRASTLLFAIESRAAQLAVQSRQAAAGYVTEVTAAEQERAFLSAIRQDRDLPVQPTIQDLERYAPQWASLVPPDPGLRVAVARLIGEKYRLPYAQVPALRQALGLDEETIRVEYERRYGHPLDQLYADAVSRREHLRWVWMRWAARLENMPPFWIAFALTLTETVGASILALPIALAGVGPLAGVGLLLVLGLINLVTIIGIVEAITRNGNMRYGNTYFGRLVTDYLGDFGRAILTPALFALSVVVLLAYYIGISTTLADATTVPSAWWGVLIFLAGMYFLRRESIDATVASALIVGAFCLVLLLTLALLALMHASTDNLSYINLPLVGQSDKEFDSAILNLIFGVVLAAYFGHTSAGNGAKLVLHRDPTGRALLWGNLAAMSVAMLLYCLWIVAVNGAVDSTTLASTAGTVLIPLADKIGGAALVLGSIYAILAMGMGSIHMQLGLFLQTREWLPPTLSRSARFWAGMIAPLVVLLVVEWLLITGRESFAGLLGFVGALALPLLSGIFPMLLLAASRRKGDYVPGVVLRALTRPSMIIFVYALYLVGVLIQGLVIWERPIERAAAVAVGLLMIVVTGIIAYRGAFVPRVVIELRVEASDTAKRGFYQMTAVGQPVEGSVQARYTSGEETFHAASGALKAVETLRAITFELPISDVRELKVWAHQITPEGQSLPLVFDLDSELSGHPEPIPLEGQVIIPVTDKRHQLTISLTCEKGLELEAKA